MRALSVVSVLCQWHLSLAVALAVQNQERDARLEKHSLAHTTCTGMHAGMRMRCHVCRCTCQHMHRHVHRHAHRHMYRHAVVIAPEQGTSSSGNWHVRRVDQ